MKQNPFKPTAYQLAQRALDARGYLVISQDDPEKVGAVIEFQSNTDFGLFSCQLKIIAETDEQDADEQDKLLGLPRRMGVYFYRVIAE